MRGSTWRGQLSQHIHSAHHIPTNYNGDAPLFFFFSGLVFLQYLYSSQSRHTHTPYLILPFSSLKFLISCAPRTPLFHRRKSHQAVSHPDRRKRDEPSALTDTHRPGEIGAKNAERRLLLAERGIYNTTGRVWSACGAVWLDLAWPGLVCCSVCTGACVLGIPLARYSQLLWILFCPNFYLTV